MHTIILTCIRTGNVKERAHRSNSRHASEKGRTVRDRDYYTCTQRMTKAEEKEEEERVRLKGELSKTSFIRCSSQWEGKSGYQRGKGGWCVIMLSE